MAHNAMQHENGYGGVYGTILSVILFFVAHFTLSDLAAVFAILAGASTAAYSNSGSSTTNPSPTTPIKTIIARVYVGGYEFVLYSDGSSESKK
jgi:hypothetical protein